MATREPAAEGQVRTLDTDLSRCHLAEEFSHEGAKFISCFHGNNPFPLLTDGYQMMLLQNVHEPRIGCKLSSGVFIPCELSFLGRLASQLSDPEAKL